MLPFNRAAIDCVRGHEALRAAVKAECTAQRLFDERLVTLPVDWPSGLNRAYFRAYMVEANWLRAIIPWRGW